MSLRDQLQHEQILHGKHLRPHAKLLIAQISIEINRVCLQNVREKLNMTATLLANLLPNFVCIIYLFYYVMF